MNLSTTSSVSSTSCSNSIADSSITSSAAKIGAETRTARARASEGRESISISEPLTETVIEAKKVLSRSSVTETRSHLASSCSSRSESRSWVIGRGVEAPCSFIRIAAASGVADPDRQELVPVDGLQQDDRLLADHVEADAIDLHLLHEWAILDSNQGPRPYQRRALTD